MEHYRPKHLLAVAHRVQQLVTSAQIQVFLERGLDPLLHAVSIPHPTFGDIGADGLGE